MRHLLVVVYMGLLLFAGTSYGQDGADATPAGEGETSTVEGDMPKVPEATPDTSEYNRKNKQFSVTAEFGLAIAPLPSGGFAAGYYVMPDLIAELSYVSGGFTIDKVDLGWSFTSIRAKWFAGNSFYLNLGYSMRTIDFKTDVTATTGGVSTQLSAEAEAKSSGIDFAIGNRWQWDYFTLGIDWIGYFMPLSSSGDSKITIPNVPASETDELNDLLDKLGETGHVQLFRFYLGASF